jgi:multiple sugar transport system substrate-binding protein
MVVPKRLWAVNRRDFLKMGGATLILVACGDRGSTTTSTSTAGVTTTGAGAGATAPTTSFRDPRTALSGDLRILLWSHFVPSHDVWFDEFVQEWGDQVGINVVVDHIAVGDVPAAIAGEIQSGSPQYDLMQYIAVLSQHEPSVLDMADLVAEAESRYGQMLDLTRRSSFNPNTGKFYAYAPAWVPDPGDYRKSLWETVGLPNGPSTWDELLEGGSQIFSAQGVQMGIGLSQEIDSNMAGRALMWSYGASIQDANENVVINSPETIAAVEYMKRLFEGAMTDEVFAWNAASNNQGLIAGELSYILNSISAWRTAQEESPAVADDVFFVPALQGPSTALAAQHVMYNWIIPDFSGINVDAAQEFLLHYTENSPSVTWHSKLYDFPAFTSLVPDLNAWLDNDPFGANPANKLAVLKNSTEWATNIGHPGPANPAVGQIFAEAIIPVMFAEAARGDKTPEQAVADAESQIKGIFEDWRGRGLVGG